MTETIQFLPKNNQNTYLSMSKDSFCPNSLLLVKYTVQFVL